MARYPAGQPAAAAHPRAPVAGAGPPPRYPPRPGANPGARAVRGGGRRRPIPQPRKGPCTPTRAPRPPATPRGPPETPAGPPAPGSCVRPCSKQRRGALRGRRALKKEMADGPTADHALGGARPSAVPRMSGGALSALSAAPGASPDSDHRYVAQLYERGSFDAVISHVGTLIALSPSGADARLFHFRGLSQLRLGHAKAAMDDFLQILVEDPTHLEARASFRLACRLAAYEALAGARETALDNEDDPSVDAEVLALYEEALRCAKQLRDSYWARFLPPHLMAEDGMPETEEDPFSSGLDPHDLSRLPRAAAELLLAARVGRAKTLLKMREVEAAVRELDRAWREGCAGCYATGPAEAEAPPAPPSPSVPHRKVSSVSTAKHASVSAPPRDILSPEASKSLLATRYQALLLLGERQVFEGRWEEATGTYGAADAAAELLESMSEVHFARNLEIIVDDRVVGVANHNLGVCLMRRGALGAAQIPLEQAVALGARDAPHGRAQSVAEQVFGAHRAALPSRDVSVDGLEGSVNSLADHYGGYDPLSFGSRLALGCVLLAGGDLEPAGEHLQEAVRQRDGHQVAILALAVALLSCGRAAEAVGHLRRLTGRGAGERGTNSAVLEHATTVMDALAAAAAAQA